MTTINVIAGAAGMVDRKNQEKLYIQIMRLLVDEICRGTWKIGDRIPSEDELAVRFGVPGKPVLAVHRLLIGPEDLPLAYSRIVEIGERFKLETEFERIR